MVFWEMGSINGEREVFATRRLLERGCSACYGESCGLLLKGLRDGDTEVMEIEMWGG